MKKTSALSVAMFLFPVGFAQAPDPPPQKEGLWSVHRQSVSAGKGKSEVTETLCRNHEYDKYIQEIQDKGKNAPGCKVLSSNASNGTYTLETECPVGESVVKSKLTTTYQGDTEVHSETHATYTPPLMGMTEINMIMDQKYIGACPAGSQPGEVTHANGKKTNAWKH
jgi:hypothetical protein